MRLKPKFQKMVSTQSKTEEPFEQSKVSKKTILFRWQNKIGDVTSFWTSGIRLGTEARFYWICNGQDFSYENWDKNEPNNYDKNNENCVELRKKSNWMWNDVQCDVKIGYICESFT